MVYKCARLLLIFYILIHIVSPSQFFQIYYDNEANKSGQQVEDSAEIDVLVNEENNMLITKKQKQFLFHVLKDHHRLLCLTTNRLIMASDQFSGDTD